MIKLYDSFFDKLDRRKTLFFFSIVSGFMINVNVMLAQSKFLAAAAPQWASIVSILAATVFCLQMPYLLNPPVQKLRYAVYLGLFAMMMVIVIQAFAWSTDLAKDGTLHDAVLNGFWLFFAILFSDCVRIMLIELSNRHVNPASIGSFYYILIIGHEIGTLIAAGLLLVKHIHLVDMSVVLFWNLILAVAVAFGFWFFFGQLNHVEVRLGRRPILLASLSKLKRNLVLSFLFFGFFAGIFRQFQDFQIRSMMKLFAQGPEDIFQMILWLYVSGSIFTLFISVCSSLLAQRRSSPLLLIRVASILILIVQLFFFFWGSSASISYSIFFLGALARGFERGVYVPSIVLILSFFVGPQRTLLRFRHHWMLLAGGGVVFLCLGFTEFLLRKSFIYSVSSYFIILSVLGILIVTWISERLLIRHFLRAIGNHKVAGILAVTGLTFLRPKKMNQFMEKALRKNPKKLLRKTIVLGLGYVQDEKSVELVMDQFSSEKEEIQLAVVEALRISNHFRGIRFLLNVCFDGSKTKSAQVRLNAASVIVALYGFKSIPILMIGLEDEDPRIVANSLEALALLKEKKLIPLFLKYVDARHQRVRANALLGLGKISKSYPEFLIRMEQILLKSRIEDPGLHPYLYILGCIRDPRFLPVLLHLEDLSGQPTAKPHPQLRKMLAWALSNLKQELGYALFWKELEQVLDSGNSPDSILHFFSQLPLLVRYEAIRQWIVAESEPSRIELKEAQIVQVFKKSRFDFHFESEYAYDLMVTLMDNFQNKAALLSLKRHY